MIGKGSTTSTLRDDDVSELLARSLEPMALDGKRVLVLVPDGTRTAPIPLMIRLLYERIGRRVARLDYLIALGTHPPMSEEAIDHLAACKQGTVFSAIRTFSYSTISGTCPKRCSTLARSQRRKLRF